MDTRITVNELVGPKQAGLVAKGKAILRGAAVALALAGFAGAMGADAAEVEQTVGTAVNSNVTQSVGDVS